MTSVRTEPTLRVVESPAQGYEEPRPGLGVQVDQWPEPRGKAERHRLRAFVLVLILCAAGAALWSVLWQPRGVTSQSSTPAPAAPRSAETSEPRYPIESSIAALPPLDGSDAILLSALQNVFGGGGIASFVNPRHVVRNFVATIDNLPRRAVPVQTLPIKPASGSFGTARAGNGLVIGEANALRYTPYVKLLQTVEPGALVALYVKHYPLFQQAYRELGYPNGHFNDRLVEVIDLMLTTPQPTAPLKVVQPKIFYEFADRDLEQLAAGQKLLLRMGPDNAAIVRKRLTEIRQLVTASGTGLAADPRELPPSTSAPKQ